jgi:CBS domain-containing protein
MDVELIEIREFLASNAPFDRLPDAALDALPQRLSVRYLRRGTAFPPDDDDTPCVYILRRGAVELRDDDGNLIGKLAEGDLCPSPCGKGAPNMAGLSGQTAEDTLAYLLPCAELDRLREAHAEFAQHFDASVSDRLRRALDTIKDDAAGTALMTVRMGDLLNRPLVQGEPDISIEQAARIMSEARVSSLVLTNDDRLLGMVTDRDLRCLPKSRCAAS